MISDDLDELQYVGTEMFGFERSFVGAEVKEGNFLRNIQHWINPNISEKRKLSRPMLLYGL